MKDVKFYSYLKKSFENKMILGFTYQSPGYICHMTEALMEQSQAVTVSSR